MASSGQSFARPNKHQDVLGQRVRPGSVAKGEIVKEFKNSFRNLGVEIDEADLRESYAIFSGDSMAEEPSPNGGMDTSDEPADDGLDGDADGGERDVWPKKSEELLPRRGEAGNPEPGKVAKRLAKKRLGTRELPRVEPGREIRTARDIEALWAGLEADARKKLGIENEAAFEAMTSLPAGTSPEQWCARNGFKADQAERLRLLMGKVDYCFDLIAKATQGAEWADAGGVVYTGIFQKADDALAWNPALKEKLDRHEEVTIYHPLTGQDSDPVTGKPLVVRSETDIREFLGDFGVNSLLEGGGIVLTFLGRARLADVDPNVGYSGEKLDERFDNARYVFLKRGILDIDGSAIDADEREAISSLVQSIYHIDDGVAAALLGPGSGTPGAFPWTRKMLEQLMRKMATDCTTRGLFGKTTMMWPGDLARLAKENPASMRLRQVLTYGSGADGEWRFAQKLALRGNRGIASCFDQQDPDPHFPFLATERRPSRSGDNRLISWIKGAKEMPRTWKKACGVEVKNWGYGRLRSDKAGPVRSVYSNLGDMAMQALAHWHARQEAGMDRAENDAILNEVVEGLILAVCQDGVDDIAAYGVAHKKLKDMNDVHPVARVLLGTISPDELRTNMEGKSDEEWNPLHLGFTAWWGGDNRGHGVDEAGYMKPTKENPGFVLIQPQRDANLFMLLRFIPWGGSTTKYTIEVKAGRLQLRPDQYFARTNVDTHYLNMEHVEVGRLNSLWFKNPRFGEAGQPEYIKDDPVNGKFVAIPGGIIPDLAWIGSPQTHEVYATTGMGGTAEPGVLAIEAITDGVGHEEAGMLRGLALAELMQIDGVAVKAALKEYRELIGDVVASGKYASVLPQQIGRNTPILGLLFDRLSEAYGCYEEGVQYLPEILANQFDVNALDVTGALASAPEKYKDAAQMVPVGAKLKAELDALFKPLARVTKRTRKESEENVFRLRMGEIALIVGDATVAKAFEDAACCRVKDFVKLYPFELMNPLAEAAWGLGIGARKLLFPPGSEPSEKGGRWNEERESECLAGIAAFVQLVKKDCGRPDVFDQPAIAAGLRRLRAFVRTGVLDGREVPGGKRYYVVRDGCGKVDYSLGRAGTVEYAEFIDLVCQEFSAFAKDVYVAMELVAMEDLDHLAPRDLIRARYGLGQDIERSLRVEGMEQLGAMLWAGLRGRHIPLLQRGDHTRVEWNHWVSSFLPSDAGKPLVMDPFVEMNAFVRVFFSETIDPREPGFDGKFFQTWDFTRDNDGKEHWREVIGNGEKSVYFELIAKRTRNRVVGYLKLDQHGQARPFVDGFTAFVDSKTRLPTARWDDSVDDEAGTYDGLPAVIDEGGNARDLGAPDSPFLETQVDPATWQCLNVLLQGWTYELEENEE